MPLFFKNFKPKWLQRILSFKIIRFFVLSTAYLWVKEIIRRTGFNSPDLIIISNIYAAPFVKILAGESIPVIYDMNDDHLAFPNTPKWARGYFESLCTVASRVVMPSESMQELLPPFGRVANFTVSNGVDFKLFRKESQIILYVGAISEWIDVELLERVAREFPKETLRLIGPVSVNVITLGDYSNVEFIGPLDRRMIIEQIKMASVCLIPFKACNLTAHTENINKLYEYLAAGKPVISIGRPPGHDGELVYYADTHDQFISAITTALREADQDMTEQRKVFAEKNDWDIKAREMAEIIREVVA